MSKIILQQNGEALALVIPAETVERLGLQAGQELSLRDHSAGFELITVPSRLDRQREIARKVLREQAETLEALARL